MLVRWSFVEMLQVCQQMDSSCPRRDAVFDVDPLRYRARGVSLQSVDELKEMPRV
jgi:hypothetical protein